MCFRWCIPKCFTILGGGWHPSLARKGQKHGPSWAQETKASSTLHSATISKPPDSSSSSDDDAAPAQEPSNVCQSATAMPTSIPDPHGTVVQPDSRSPSGSPPCSPPTVTALLLTHDPPSTHPKRQNMHLQRPSTEKSFRSSSNRKLIQHLEAMPAHLPTRCQRQQRKSPQCCQKVILLLQLTNIYPSTSSNWFARQIRWSV